MEETDRKRQDLAAAVASLPFVSAHGVEISITEDGRAVARMDFAERYSTPPDLFPASMVGMLGDIAAITACTAAQPAGNFCATLDFTVKMIASANGVRLEAEGRALQSGTSTCVGQADIHAVSATGERTHCAVVLATGRVVRPRNETN